MLLDQAEYYQEMSLKRTNGVGLKNKKHNTKLSTCTCINLTQMAE